MTERLLGVGGNYAIASGVLAARAIINGFDNKDFDNLVSILGTPGIKQLVTKD
ncbi:MAG: hypothetical protein ACM3TR_04910 [Caulobacteraceae bacterium]